MSRSQRNSWWKCRQSHSSSSWSWPTACSRFSPKTEFYSDAFFGGAHFPSSAKRTSERIEEQLVDTSLGGGLAQGSASSAGPADENFAGFFALFPVGNKVRVPPRVRVRSCPGRSAHGLRRLMWRPVVRMRSRARPSTGTDVLVCPPGSLLRASRSSGSGRWMRKGTTITGTGKHVPVHMSFLLFLLSEELHRQPRAVNKYWAPYRLCWENTYAVGWFLSTAPRIWQSPVRCSPWFDSGYMLRQFTAVGDC